MSTLDNAAKVTLYGVDDSEWVISPSGFSPVVIDSDPPPSGLWDSPVNTVWDSTARQYGASFRAVRWEPRDITFVLDIDGAGEGRDWQRTDSRFRRALSYEKDAKLKIEIGDSARWLFVRMWQAPEPKTTEGQIRGHGKIAYYLRAGNPFYTSAHLTDTFEFDGRNYVGSLEIENPSDQPMFLKYAVRGAGSVILPDINLSGTPEDKDKKIVLPFQRTEQNVVVNTRRDVEQVVCAGYPNWWARMAGQLFWYEVPPYTPRTEIPVAINPLPWIPNVLKALNLPVNLPNRFLFKTAEILTGMLSPLPADTVLAYTPETLAEKINDALGTAREEFQDEVNDEIAARLTIPSIGELISRAYGSVATMAGCGVKVYCEPNWSRPWGLA